MELFESESEESEKDLEDSKTPYLASFEKNKTSSTEGSLKNRPLQCLLKKDKELGEINTPPPELGLI